MAEHLFTQDTLSRVLGAARLLKFIRAGWLTPVKRTPNRVLFAARDVHLVLKRLERGERPAPDHIESLRTNRAYVHKGRKLQPAIWDLELDLSDLTTHV